MSSATAPEVFPELLRRGVAIDVVTDQTSAHDPLSYLPEGVSLEDWAELAAAKPEEFTDRARASMARQVQAMVEFQDAGAEVFDYGNSIRDEARQGGYERAFEFPGFVPAYIRPLFCEGKGPFRWAALSGDPKDIHTTDEAVLKLFPDNDRLQKWMRGARERIAFQGLPARICWLGYGERDRAGLAFNDLVASGAVSAPIVIGRDHLDCGSVASPYRETEAMADGSDAIADWPLLNALVNTASGASWVSIHHGGGVGIGRSIHAGQVCLADGTDLAAQKLARVLSNDPGMGVIRHVDAGYDAAVDVAAERGVRVPMRESARLRSARALVCAAGGCVISESARSFDRQWADLAEIGRHPHTGGYRRYALTREDHDLREWFAGEAAGRGLEVTTDRVGNQWAWWGDPDTTPGVVTGSHLDSVPDGGAYDGPLGVVSAFVALDRLRAEGFAASTTAGHRELRRRGGCPVRRRLRRVAGAHRGTRARARVGAARRRRDLDGRGAAGRRPGSGRGSDRIRRRCVGSAPSSSCTSNRAGD